MGSQTASPFVGRPTVIGLVVFTDVILGSLSPLLNLSSVIRCQERPKFVSVCVAVPPASSELLEVMLNTDHLRVV